MGRVNESERVTVINPARALWNQRNRVVAAGNRLSKLIDAVARPNDLPPHQWAQFFALILEFRPEVIIELGRGCGNSLSCFLEAANQLGGRAVCQVHSLDREDNWTPTADRIKTFVPMEWFLPANVLICNILNFDFSSIVQPGKRHLIFWDAHGFEVAECVLGKLLPLLVDQEHIVAMHDVFDSRYECPPPGYGSAGLWKGANAEEQFFCLENTISSVAQTISVIDFKNRNHIPFHSAGQSFVEFQRQEQEETKELQRVLGKDFFTGFANWFWFTLAEAEGEVTFPKVINKELTLVEQLEQECKLLKQECKLLKQENEDLNAGLASVNNSTAWKLAQRFYRLRDRAAPEGSWLRTSYDWIRARIR